MAKKTTQQQQFVIVRTTGAGVHAGYLVRRDSDAVQLRDGMRIWRWTMPAGHQDHGVTLSALARHGAGPRSCISETVSECTILGVHEILVCTSEAQATLTPRWVL